MKILHFSVKSSFRIRKNSKSRILPELMTKNHSFSRVSRMSRAAPRAVSKGASVESSIFKSLSEPAKQFMDRERLTALVSTPPELCQLSAEDDHGGIQKGDRNRKRGSDAVTDFVGDDFCGFVIFCAFNEFCERELIQTQFRIDSAVEGFANLAADSGFPRQLPQDSPGCRTGRADRSAR